MNCPTCHGRNPSDSKHCLHCGAPFPGAREDDEKDPNRWLNYVFIGAAILIGSLMFLFGFDTVKVECTESPARIAEYEGDVEWSRNTSEEGRRKEIEYERMYGRSSLSQSQKLLPNLRCYQKKTGRVEGVVK